jgi:hypothetical protein
MKKILTAESAEIKLQENQESKPQNEKTWFFDNFNPVYFSASSAGSAVNNCEED